MRKIKKKSNWRPKFQIIPNEIFNEILKDYKDNIPYYKLTEKYGYDRIIIQDNFKIRNIDFSKRIYIRDNQKVIRNVFEDLNNPEVQYWLGWIASDGAIRGTRLSLGIKKDDREILEKFKIFLKSDIKISDVKKVTKNKTYFGCRITFRNKELINYLKNLGIGERKSTTIKINFPITWDFLRGVIEGDGYIDSNKNRIQLTSASIDFLSQISEFLNQQNISHAIYKHKPSKAYSLQIHALPSVFKFINLLYTNAHTFLQRKYDNAAQIRNNLVEKYSKFREPA